MEKIKKYCVLWVPVIFFCLSIVFITDFIAVDDSFGMTSPSFGESARFIPTLLITLLIAMGSFFTIICFFKCRANRKKNEGGGVNSSWFIGMTGSSNKNTKRQIVQLYDI